MDFLSSQTLLPLTDACMHKPGTCAHTNAQLHISPLGVLRVAVLVESCGSPRALILYPSLRFLALHSVSVSLSVRVLFTGDRHEGSQMLFMKWMVSDFQITPSRKRAHGGAGADCSGRTTVDDAEPR